jgi:hypothetical protein
MTINPLKDWPLNAHYGSTTFASHLYYPLIRVNPGSIFGWGLIFIFGGLVNFIF